MRIIGLDYGSRTVGIALSDPTGRLAFPLETVTREEEVNLKATVRRIRALCEEHDVHLVVLGNPIRMDGKSGPVAEKVKAFQKRLERDLYLVDVVLWDERLTTVQAERPLKDAGMDRIERKKVVDQMAAAIMLQAYLDVHGQEEAGNRGD